MAAKNGGLRRAVGACKAKAVGQSGAHPDRNAQTPLDQDGYSSWNLRHRDLRQAYSWRPQAKPEPPRPTPNAYVTNNGSERKLRPCVIQRKVTNGNRALWAAQAEADVRTTIDTARLRAANPFEVILATLA